MLVVAVVGLCAGAAGCGDPGAAVQGAPPVEGGTPDSRAETTPPSDHAVAPADPTDGAAVAEPLTVNEPSEPVRAREADEPVIVVATAPAPQSPNPPPRPAAEPPIVQLAPPTPIADPPAADPPLAPAAPAAETPRPAPATLAKSGELKCNGAPIVQNAEVVFSGLPAGTLRLTVDAEVWDARTRPDADGTQRIVLRNKKPGTQRRCTVTWQLIE